jgi:PTH1 family peptidyl-tRNA hydrolase
VTDFLIVGLGNPGAKYRDSRHNVGFRTIDVIAERHSVKMQGPKFWQRNVADAGRGRIGDAEVILVKPQTFYNNTGRAVQHFMARERVKPAGIIAIYDDLDLPEGRIRMRPNGSHGGNNGLKSIIEAAGSEFGRIRVGIGRPLDNGVPSWDPDVVVRYVLAAPDGDSARILGETMERVSDAVEAIIRDGWERAMDVYNRAESGKKDNGRAEGGDEGAK